MSNNRKYYQSIISAPDHESEASRIGSTNPQRNYNQPLINSAVTSGNMSDEDIARQQQERLYFESFMEVDPPPQAAATSIDPRRLEEIDTDAAIARQLQEEEYSRNSLLPFSSFGNKSLPYNDPTLNDATIAAQLQAEEEEQRQRRHHPQRPTPNEPEVIPIPPRVRPPQPPQQPSSATGNNHHANDPLSFLRHIAARGRASRGSRHRGNQGLQNRTEDFGPNDYEDLLELDKAVEKKLLTDDEINRLPIEKFQPRPNQRDEDNKCNICWDDFEKNQSLRRLQCLHLYHKDCIDPWLRTSNQCPICRSATN